MSGIGSANTRHDQSVTSFEPHGASEPALLTIMRLIDEQAQMGQPAFGSHMQQVIDFASLQLRRWQSSQASNQPRRGLAGWQVKRVTAHMRDNLEKEIDLQEMADLVELSRFYFCSAFRMATGYTPHEWLMKLRIDAARRMLTTTSAPITQIALAVGYQTPSAFAAAFRRLAGTSPREFRRRSRS